MANDEQIGGVSIGVTADFSDLDAQFAAAVARAVSEGATLAEAIERSVKPPDVSGVTDALSEMGAAAQGAAEQLSLFDAAAHVDYSDAVGQLNMFATELEPIGAAAQAAAGAVAEFGSAADMAARPIGSTVVASNELGDAASKAGAGATEASGSWASFGSTLLGMTGIALTVEGLKELVLGSIEAADKLGDTKQALEILGGSAEQAEETIGRLRDLAQDEGLAFPKLLTASVRLTALLPEGADVVNILSKIGNAAELFGTSIEAAASKFTNVVESGNASVRSLSALGLKMDDVRDAMTKMGASATTAFKDLNQEDRLNVLTLAMGKLDGAANKLNDDVSGDWTRTMNQAWAVMAKLGDVISPLAQSTLPGLGIAMKVVESAAVVLFVGAATFVDTLVNSVSIALTAIKGLGMVWKEAMQGNFVAAAGEAATAFDKMKTTATTAFDGMAQTAFKSAQLITSIWTDSVPKSIEPTKTAVHGITTEFDKATEKTIILQKATRDWLDVSVLAISSSQAWANAVDGAASKVTALSVSLERARALQEAIRQAVIDGTRTQEDYNKAAANTAKIYDEYIKALGDVDKLNRVAETGFNSMSIAVDQVKVSTDKMTQGFRNTLADIAPTTGELQKLGLLLPTLAPPIDATNRAMIDFGIGAGKAKTAVQDLHTPVETLIGDLGKLADKARDTKDWTPVIQALDEFDKRIQNLSKTDLPEAVAQMSAWIDGMIKANVPTELVRGQLDKLGSLVSKMAKEDLPGAAAAWAHYLAQLQQIPSSLGEILAAQEREAAAAIKTAEANGEGAEQWILKLKAVQLQQQIVKDQADGMGRTYVALIDDVLKGFDSMSKAIADNIIDGKDWGQVWEGLLKSFAKNILETVIQGALMPLKDALMALIGKLLPDIKLGLDASANAAKGLADAAKQAADSASNMSKAADKVSEALGSGGGPAGGGSGLAGSVSHLASIIGVISEVISAGAAVASTIILSHISSDTGHIEVNTRGQLAEALNLRADLWVQHNGLYDRLGECKNDLDGILSALLSKTGGTGGLSEEAMSDLDLIAANSKLTVAALQSIGSTVVSLLSGSNMQVLGLQNINSSLFAIHDDLGVLIGRVDAVVSAIIYGSGQQREAYNNAQSAFHELTTQSNNQARAIVRAVDDGTTVGHADDTASLAQQIAIAQAARAAATAQYASAMTIADQVKALQAKLAADNQLAILAQQAGDSMLAAQARAEALSLGQDIQALIPQIGTVTSSVNSIYNRLGVSDSNIGTYLTTSTTQIVGAVNSSASVIANAVSGALVSLGIRPAGAPTTVQVPPRGTQTNVPGAESTNPGNSNSPTGNTEQPGGVGTGGGYSTPLTSPVPPTIRNPTYAPIYNADGSPATGNAVNTPVPFDPLNPFTWQSNAGPGQAEAIAAAHGGVPSYGTGGLVAETGLAEVAEAPTATGGIDAAQQEAMLRAVANRAETIKDAARVAKSATPEMAPEAYIPTANVPADPSAAMAKMAGVPSGGAPKAGGAEADCSYSAKNITINAPVTFNGVVNAREMAQLFCNHMKEIIPNATAYSS